MDDPLLHKVPGHSLYIGGFISLRRPEALANCKITHILSVINWKFAENSPLIRGYKHMHIPVDDMDDENLVEWFPKSNAFIEQGLRTWQNDSQDSGTNQSQNRDIDGSSGVLVHCAMGKSRSATIIIAYLLWNSHRYRITSSAPTPHTVSAPNSSRDLSPLIDEALNPETALALLRQGRPLAEPNDGFMEQLHLYHSMGCPDSINSQPKYQRWLYQKAVQESLNVHRAPELDNILFEDEHDEGDEPRIKGGRREIDIKCRKCRRLLAQSNFLVEHEPPHHSAGRGGDAQSCAHLFLHPLSWMRGCLKEGELDGRLTCPNEKCGANVGKFAWQGMRCSCGGWVTPGFGLSRGKVDEVTELGKTGYGNVGSGAGVRLPPGMRKEGGLL